MSRKPTKAKRSKVVTFRTAMNRYVESALDLRPSTVRKLGYLATSWEKRTSNPRIERIGHATFAEFRRNCLAENLSPHGIEKAITDVITILKSNRRNVEAGRRLKLDDPDPYCPPLSDLGKVYLACKHAKRPRLRYCPAPEYLRAFIVFALWTGFRLSDMISVTRADIDEHTIRRRANKTGKVHEIPNCEVVRRHLAELPKRDGPIFPAGRSCTTRIRQWLTAVCKLASVPRFTPQNLRVAAVNSWSDANFEAGVVIQGEGITGRKSALRFYLVRNKPRKILDKAAPSFVWPAEMLLPRERSQRERSTKALIEVVRRVPAEKLPDLHRVALAFSEA